MTTKHYHLPNLLQLFQLIRSSFEILNAFYFGFDRFHFSLELEDLIELSLNFKGGHIISKPSLSRPPIIYFVLL